MKRACFYALTVLSLVIALHACALAQTPKGAAYSILIDNTGSLRTQFSEVQALGHGVVKRLHQSGPISLFNFERSGDPKNPVALAVEGVERSRDRNVLDRYIESLLIEAGQTTLLDAISEMTDKLSAGSEAGAAKAIILITDGENRTSKVKEKQLIQTLKERGIRVYAVGLVQELEDAGDLLRTSKKAQAVSFLKKITGETGGRVLFPKAKGSDREALLDELCAGLTR